jgi:hypothetical protein
VRWAKGEEGSHEGAASASAAGIRLVIADALHLRMPGFDGLDVL